MISTEDVGLKPFEEKFEKTFEKGSLIKSSDSIKKEFTTKLLSNFAPTSIKPENDFYSYINYQWLKNVSLQKQQKIHYSNRRFQTNTG